MGLFVHRGQQVLPLNVPRFGCTRYMDSSRLQKRTLRENGFPHKHRESAIEPCASRQVFSPCERMVMRQKRENVAGYARLEGGEGRKILDLVSSEPNES